MGVVQENIGNKGDIWKFYMPAGFKFPEIVEHHMLLEFLNEARIFPGDPKKYYWKTYNLGSGIFEELGINYDPRYWTKVG